MGNRKQQGLPPGTGLNKARFFDDLHYEPHPGQLEVHASNASRRVLACGVRWGKTLCAAMEGLSAAMEPVDRSVGWIVAPTYDLCDKVFRELVILAAEHLRHRIVTLKESERKLILRNMAGGFSEIRGKSADNPVSLLGEGLSWCIIDEAARLKAAIWESHLTQRLIDKDGWALLISTPRGKGWFYDLFRRGQRGASGYASWNHPSWTNPHLNAALIEQERDRLPERVFMQEYGGGFLEGAGAVFRNVRESATGAWHDPVPGKRYYGGLDLAKVQDYSVLVILNQDAEVVFADRFHRLDWAIQVRRVQAAAERYNRADVFMDSTGAGEPVYEAFRHAGCPVRPYAFTARSKAALIDNLVLMLERGEITLPTPDLWPDGIDELESFEYTVTDSGNVRSGAPGQQHDDCVIGLALAAWALRRRRRHHYSFVAPEIIERVTPTW